MPERERLDEQMETRMLLRPTAYFLNDIQSVVPVTRAEEFESLVRIQEVKQDRTVLWGHNLTCQMHLGRHERDA